MRRTPNRPGPRAGFTLVELLVVMTIIAILFSLTAAAVVKAIQKSDELRTRNDISQLQAGVQAFKTDFGVAYVPSRIILPPALDQTGESQQYISSLWPRLPASVVSQMPVPPATFAYWGVSPSNTQGVPLSGDQCLVFFLGGYRDPTTNNCFGFSTNPLVPLNPPSAGETRKGPYFEFPPARLAVYNHNSGVAADPFPSFIDTYGVLPYLYFSSRKAANDYPTTATGPLPISVVAQGATYTVYPYQLPSSSLTVWANKSGFQIVSGGRDTQFHTPGGTAGGLNWIGGNGSIDQYGYDNVANFHPTLLGVPAN